MRRWAALLRGVNLNGRKLPSADLKAIVESLGYGDVRTLLASGNVLFATDEPEDVIVARLEAAFAAYGLTTDVLLRDRAGIQAAIDANPFVEEAADHPSHLLVVFHREPFPPSALERIPDHHRGPERLQAIGRELYIDFLGSETMRESKLDQAMRKARFPAIATARNWNTVGKLLALL
ncbi:DUF1697 domain-containing protein [Sphingomonas sp. HF-S3]|uniref:DUF1697 domain-containing protein n=1 Tax=Sphingomonas rustica TaxID=3103142 RepID=A0ABV0BCF8_9SPHN